MTDLSKADCTFNRKYWADRASRYSPETKWMSNISLFMWTLINNYHNGCFYHYHNHDNYCLLLNNLSWFGLLQWSSTSWTTYTVQLYFSIAIMVVCITTDAWHSVQLIDCILNKQTLSKMKPDIVWCYWLVCRFNECNQRSYNS